MKIKTASDLKWHVEQSGDEPFFFTRDTMRFFGDRMSNYGIRQPRPIVTNMGETVPAYELTRRRPVKHGLQSSAFFHAETFRRVFPATHWTNPQGNSQNTWQNENTRNNHHCRPCVRRFALDSFPARRLGWQNAAQGHFRPRKRHPLRPAGFPCDHWQP
jgi:hypothetical protein